MSKHVTQADSGLLLINKTDVVLIHVTISKTTKAVMRERSQAPSVFTALFQLH